LSVDLDATSQVACQARQLEGGQLRRSAKLDRVGTHGRSSVELNLRLPSPSTELSDDRLERAGVRLILKRDDIPSCRGTSGGS